VSLASKSFSYLFDGSFTLVSKKTRKSFLFVAIPSSKNPRWIIGTDPVSLQQADKIVRPSNLSSKVFVLAVFFLVRVRLTVFLSRYYVEVSEGEVCRGNIYIGAKGVYQKLTIQKIKGDAVSYTKVAVTTQSRARIRQEVAALNTLSGLGVLVGSCPKLLAAGSDYVELTGAPSQVSKWGVVFNGEHLKPLCELLATKTSWSDVDAGSFLAADFYLPEGMFGQVVRDSIKERIAEISASLSGRDVHVCYSHGDYSPWNVLYGDHGEVFVFDWEMAAIRPLGWDLFNFIIHSEILAKKNWVTFSGVLGKYEKFIAAYFAAAEVEGGQASQYLKLYLCQMLDVYSSQLYENRKGGVEFEASLIGLINNLACMLETEW
jgi:hypothetical protein